jgi:hypothetical protein
MYIGPSRVIQLLGIILNLLSSGCSGLVRTDVDQLGPDETRRD